METPGERLVRRYLDEVWSRGNSAALAELLAPDARLNDEVVDLDEFGADVDRWFAIFPDFTATVDELLTFGDRVVSRVTYRGTHRGTFAGLAPTGKSFAVLGIDIFRESGGRLVEQWHSTDHYEVVAQLGGTVVPRS